MGTYLLDGWTAIALGALAGGCREGWLTPRASTTSLGGAVAARFAALGARCRTVDPNRGPVAVPYTGEGPVAPAPLPDDPLQAGPPASPVLWACVGEELAAVLAALAAGQPSAGAAGAAARRPGTGGVRAANPAVPPPAAVAVVALPPSPGIGAALAAPHLRWIWSPGSSRMAYRLAAAAGRAAGREEGPCLILLDGELPPETVDIPPDQVPAQAWPAVRTGPRDVTDPAPPDLGAALAAETLPLREHGQTPVPGPGDLLPAVAAAPGPEDLTPFHHAGPDNPDLLLVGTGTAFGELARARTELSALGWAVAHLHLRQLRPFPANLVAPIWSTARDRMLVEPPGGGLARYLASALGLPAAPRALANLDHLAAALQEWADTHGPPPGARAPGTWGEAGAGTCASP